MYDYEELYKMVVLHEGRYSELVATIKKDVEDLSNEIPYDEAQLLTDISQLFREFGDFALELQDRLDTDIVAGIALVDEWIAKKNNQSM